MLQENKIYSTEELKKELNIPLKQWNTRREELLNYFHLFFNYEIIVEGRSKFYKIIEIYEDYEPLPRKKKTTEIASFYKEKTHEIVEKQPLNTGSNIARMIINEDNKYNHAELTATRYVRPIVKNDYVKDSYQWCFMDYTNNKYDALTEEELDYLRECFANSSTKDKILDETMLHIDAYLNNIIDKQELCNAIVNKSLNSYKLAMDRFKEKYGKRPMAVPLLTSKEGAF